MLWSESMVTARWIRFFCVRVVTKNHINAFKLTLILVLTRKRTRILPLARSIALCYVVGMAALRDLVTSRIDHRLGLL